MRRSPILGALLLPLVALACESDNATEESILAPPVTCPQERYHFLC